MQLKSKMLMAAVALVVTMVFSLAMIYKTREPPERNTYQDVVLFQLDALQLGDIDKAYSLTSSAFQDVTSHRDFSRFSDRYDIFRNNVSANIISASEDANTGFVKVGLTSDSELVTIVNFDLIKEKDAWKISYMNVVPPSSEQIDKQNKLLTKVAPLLPNFFNNADNRYTIKYPRQWMRENLDNGTLVLSGTRMSGDFYSSVNIQTVLTKKTGGHFKIVQDLIKDIKHQIVRMAAKSSIIDSGPITVTQKNGEKAIGEYLIFSYTYNGYEYQQWDVIVTRHDGQVFYVFAYTAPIKEYHTSLPVAEAILASWEIY